MSSEHHIPISVVDLGPEVEELLLSVVRSGSIAQGPVVSRLEREFAEMIGARHVIAVNNGTTALIAAMQCLGLGPGDEVVTSPFTFVATLNAILSTGATATFADISCTDFTLDPASVETAISESTRALMPVHLYGQCADMPALESIARDHDLAIVEDAAQAHGATIDGRHAGTWGIGCFSLYATKNLTSAEGGLISTDDDDIADRLRVLRNQGMRQRYQYEMAGYNYRLTDLQAALCVPGLATYADRVERRRANAARLNEGLGDLPGIVVPSTVPGRGHVWHQYTVLVGPEAAVTRDEMVDTLGRHGVGCGIYYPKLAFDYDCYRDRADVQVRDVPVAARVVESCLSLPVHPSLTTDELDIIIRTVRAAASGRPC